MIKSKIFEELKNNKKFEYFSCSKIVWIVKYRKKYIAYEIRTDGYYESVYPNKDITTGYFPDEIK